jgi:L,D-transpeptidase-like protein/putative peptidoglycan binding protein/PKD domain-containing protein
VSALLASLAAASFLASPGGVTIDAAPQRGAAPLTVTLSATPGFTAYRWSFGDGGSGEGRVVQHTFAAGEWNVHVDADGAGADTVVDAYAVELAAPGAARYGRRAAFAGSTRPALGDAAVVLFRGATAAARGRTRADGTFTLRARALSPGPWHVEVDGIPSPDATTRLVPRLTTRLAGSGLPRRRLELRARLTPAAAGALRVQVWRGRALLHDATGAAGVGLYRVRLDTRRRGTLRVRVSVVPADGYGGGVHVLRALVGLRRLQLGSDGAAVRGLTSRLRALHYAAPAAARFDSRVLDAVYAFQKAERLPRTGVVDARFWRRLANSHAPSPRYRSPASHLEVNKPRQVLFVVRHGRVALVVPVSTAGLPGRFTPEGRFSIYRKVGGFDPSPLGTLYDPMYFTGGYAIHGNPSVPPYPASHGCVRVPMWLAARLYWTNPYGETVYVY